MTDNLVGLLGHQANQVPSVRAPNGNYEHREAQKPKGAERINPFVFSDEFALADDAAMLIDGYFPASGVNLTFAPKDHFKSFNLTGQLMSIATGVDWHGYKVTQGPVIYIAGEGNTGLQKRCMGWCMQNNVDFSKVPIAICKWPMQVLNDVDMMQWQDDIDAYFVPRYGKPVAIAVDTLATNFGPGDENSPTDMARFIANLKRYIEAKYECSVMVIHHTGHSNKDRARGGSSLEMNAEEVYYLRKPDADQPMLVELVAKHTKDREKPPPLLMEARVQLMGKIMSNGKEASTLVMVKSLTPLEEQIRRQYDKGESLREIAESVRITWPKDEGKPPSKSTVGRIVDKLRHQGFIDIEKDE